MAQRTEKSTGRATSAEPPEGTVRLSSGSPGLDKILGGGFFKGGIYVVSGPPGSGKTTFSHQLCFRAIGVGHRALYVTLLAETHARMLGQMQAMRFFSPEVIGQELIFINGFSTMEADGLEGLLKLVRRAVRDHRASILVLDGMLPIGSAARSTVDYKKFINELQTWSGIMGCTVLFLTSSGDNASVQPEHSMVDGIFELAMHRLGLRAVRHLYVTKFRGSAYLEGVHTYEITEDGLVVYPRLESYRSAPEEAASTRRLSTGIPGLDERLGGGLRERSATLVLGPPGTGKTTLGLHFLAEGARAGEQGLYFGFFEPPQSLRARADALGLGFSEQLERRRLSLSWTPPGELHLDALAAGLLEDLERAKAERLLLDGLSALRHTLYPERLPIFSARLNQELRARGVTALVTEELCETSSALPAVDCSAAFQNLLSLRQVEEATQRRRLFSILKTRDSEHARGLWHEFELTAEGFEVGPPCPPRGARRQASRPRVIAGRGKKR